jgi:RNA polymerase subunit RPABC4/transcription elongation factor Spt4
MTFTLSALNSYALVLTGFGAAFLLALWISFIIWTFRDIRGRSRDPLLRILAVLIVALLFLPGIVVYLFLRPAQTLEGEYKKTLEEEALLQTIEEKTLCPSCGRRIREDWLFCPKCQTKLKRTCQDCGRAVDLAWNICPFCGTPAPEIKFEGLASDDLLTSLPAEKTRTRS